VLVFYNRYFKLKIKLIMKNLILPIIVALSLSSFAQDNEVTKTGWNFGALPTITFDTDLGFQYGALVDLYQFGDGSRYPRYDHKLYFEVSRFTKGSGINRFFYDSDRLVKGLQTSLDISYLTDQAYDFFGFNGFDAVINAGWFDQDSPDYISRMYYKYDRKLFRFKVDIQGKLAGDYTRWITGFNLQNFRIASVDVEKLNKGKDEEDLLPPQNGLFEKYQQWGIISDDEAEGGFIPTLKAGLVYDSRDNQPNPMKGVWTEAVVEAAPGFLGSESSFAKLALIHRQYFTLIPRDLSLVYRLAYQQTIAGDVPFYYQTQVMTSMLTGALSEGLGGAKTIRGIYRNRVVGDGFFYGNLEMRWKFVHFTFIKNNFYLGLNAFTDFGQVTDKISVEPENATGTNLGSYFKNNAEALHFSYGGGLRVVMNENFVVSMDYGRAVKEQDGKSGMYIGINYLF
jgi:outer membrane protein assembly factor BamA